MSEPGTEPGTDMILIQPTGELVDAGDADACLVAFRRVQEIQNQLYEAKRALTRALVGYSQHVGARTVTLPSGAKFVREGGPTKQYDVTAVEEGLRAAGMAEERIGEIVVQKVTVTVNGREAAIAARANAEYAAVLEAAATEVDAPYKVKPA